MEICEMLRYFKGDSYLKSFWVCLSFGVTDKASGTPRTIPSSRARPHLGFKVFQIIETYSLVTLEGIGYLLVFDSVLSASLPGEDLQWQRAELGRRWKAPQAAVFPYQENRLYVTGHSEIPQKLEHDFHIVSFLLESVCEWMEFWPGLVCTFSHKVLRKKNC